VVLEHGSPLGLYRLCVGHAFMLVACVAYACSPCACYICIMSIMDVVMSPCEG